MCAAMLDALGDVARPITGVEAVMIDHAEGRGFCAGGDIRMIAEAGGRRRRGARLLPRRISA
jgi:enoyl-CoA hydratase